MFDLFIEFDGVCAFVPSRNRDKMKVILVNALDGGGEHVGGHHMHAPPHFAVIGFSPENLQPPSQPQIITDRGNRGVEGIRLLEWQDIEVIRGAAPKGLKIAGGRRPGSNEPRFDGDQMDFSWLVEMGKIDPDLSEIDPLCLAPDPPRNKVLARMSLSHGEIFANEIAGPKPNVPFIWEFKTHDGKEVSACCQALANQIVWRMKVHEPDVTLRLWSFSGNPVASELRFAPVNNRPVKIQIKNLPLDDILGLRKVGYPEDSGRFHFPLLARVVKGQAKKAWIPEIVAQRTDPAGPVRGGTTACIGGSLAGG